MLVGEIHRGHHVHREPVDRAQVAQRVHIAAPAAAEPVVVPDHQLPHAASLQQHAPHERLGGHGGDLPVEAQEIGDVERRLRQHLAPLRPGGQERRRGLGFTTSSG